MIKQYHGMSLTGHEQILFQTIERTFARLGVLANGFGHPYSAVSSQKWSAVMMMSHMILI